MKSPGRALLWAVLPLLLLTPLLIWQGRRLTAQLAETERGQTQRTLELHADALQRSFDRVEARLDSLTAFVAGQMTGDHFIDGSQFNTFAAGLRASAQWIRAFQVVSNGIIIHTYPLKGNESILGYNLLADPRPVLGADVLRAQLSGRVTITGPIDLIQGGLGIMVRKPVPQTNGSSALLAAVILNLAPLLDESGMGPDALTDIQLAVRNQSGQVFFGSPSVFLQQPVTRRITLPDGAWEMAACPAAGWQPVLHRPALLFYGGGFLVVCLLCALFFVLARSQADLTQTVLERTEALRSELAARQHSQVQFDLIMKNLTDMVAVLDLTGHRLYNSPSYTEIIGDPDQLKGTSSFQEIHPDDRARVQQAFQETVRTGVGHRLQYRLVDQNGAARHIESQGSVIRDDSDEVTKIVVVSRDVTERQQTEKILHDNEARYRFLFEHNPMPMLIYERETLHMLAVNEAFLEHYGYSSDEALALHLTDLYPEDQKQKIAGLIPQLHGAANVGEWRHRKRDGSFITIMVNSHDLLYDGRAARVAVMTDITERKRVEAALRESEERLRLLGDNLPDSYVYQYLLEPDGAQRFLYLSAGVERVHALEPAAILRDASVLHGQISFEQLPALARAEAASLRSMSDFEMELKMCRADGQWRWLQLRSRPRRSSDGQIIWDGVATDVTARRQAEEEIRQLHEALQRHAAELELRVAERTEELVLARDRAEVADQTKSAFLATMSHELRTPLNSIIGFTGILHQGLAGPLNAEQKKQLEMVRNSARHLLALINDVLDISKIEAGQVEIAPAPFSLGDAIDKVVQSVTPLAQKKQLPLVARTALGPGQITSDRRRVEQILLNLLSNAIKFTERGSVTLTAEITAGTVSISIADTGIGIQAADLPKLFQPFRQLDTGLTRQHEGTGLGLVICKRLVERLGGVISVDSQWGAGSKFQFTLPVQLEKKS